MSSGDAERIFGLNAVSVYRLRSHGQIDDAR
jgi:hypothetical protein